MISWHHLVATIVRQSTEQADLFPAVLPPGLLISQFPSRLAFENAQALAALPWTCINQFCAKEHSRFFTGYGSDGGDINITVRPSGASEGHLYFAVISW